MEVSLLLHPCVITIYQNEGPDLIDLLHLAADLFNNAYTRKEYKTKHTRVLPANVTTLFVVLSLNRFDTFYSCLAL